MRPLQKLAREEVLGRYRLIARLGQGGMADVFLARLVGAGGFEKLVAVKRMLPGLASDPRFVAMFLNEGRIAAHLDHPNVCHVYELDEADGTLFLAMEFLRGLPWSEVVPAIPDRPRTTLVRFVAGAIAQVCEGLHHAHTAVGADGQLRSIVHRDVSPTNLFVTNEGVVKLLDFGVSKVLTESGMTATGTIKGKLPYMSPEQLRARSVDARTDIFSLAVVAWEALAGRALFDRASDYETVMAVAEADVPVLPGDDPMTKLVDAVLRRALARDRAHRHGSTREFADDLRRATTAYGAPMTAIEIQTHFSTWLGPSLARRGRELAALVGGWQRLEEMTDERTLLHVSAPVTGVRLRDVSVAVGYSALEATRVLKEISTTNSTDTITDPMHVSTPEPLDIALITTSSELTLPCTASPGGAASVGVTYSSDTAIEARPTPTVLVPGLTLRELIIEPTTEQTTAPTRNRVEIPRDPAPVGRPYWVPTEVMADPPRLQRPSLVMLSFALFAVVAAVVAWLLLA